MTAGVDAASPNFHDARRREKEAVSNKITSAIARYAEKKDLTWEFPETILHSRVPREKKPVVGTELIPRRRASIVIGRLAGGEHSVVVCADVYFGVVPIFLVLIKQIPPADEGQVHEVSFHEFNGECDHGFLVKLAMEQSTYPSTVF
jgi:hypothetical protein